MSEPARAGRVLGVDYGTRRIGLAVSDPGGTLALPAGTLESRGLRRDLEALCALARERAVERIVVGLPLRLSGRRGPECEAAERFAAALGEATGLPVDLFDERWTTLEAERALRASDEGPARGGRHGRSPRPRSGAGARGADRSRGGGRRAAERRRAHVDSVAATLLLRTYLERRANVSAEASSQAGSGALAGLEGVGER